MANKAAVKIIQKSNTVDISEELEHLRCKYDDKILHQHMVRECQAFQSVYMDYPMIVHLETIALCNAKCGFCPYETMERQGVKMSDDLIVKILNDLRDIPPNVPFSINPYKVSEPFLEPRLFDILEAIIHNIPNAKIGFITNASPLTEKKIKLLSEIDPSRFTPFKVSLNTLDPVEYESIMKIPLEKTLKRLDVLHTYVSKGIFKPRVDITRVANDIKSDTQFIAQVKSRYPNFNVYINHRNDWIGKVELENAKTQIPNVPCRRWFDLSITATGQVAMCCMDSEAQYPKGDVNHQRIEKTHPSTCRNGLAAWRVHWPHKALSFFDQVSSLALAYECLASFM